MTNPQTDGAGLYVALEGGERSTSAEQALDTCFNARAFSGVSPADREAVASADSTLLRIESERLTLAGSSCCLRLHEALLKSLLSE